MNLTNHINRLRNNKKGSYIVETVIALPIFIIAIMTMCSIILMYSCIASSNFIAATEFRRAGAEAIYANTGLLVPGRIKNRVMKSSSKIININTIEYKYGTERFGEDELIITSMLLEMECKNPIGIDASADYELSLVSRLYVGKERDNKPMSASEMMNEAAEPVYIFPKRGEKYHTENCGVLKAASKSGVLTEKIKRKYNSCPVCHSKNAQNGSLVYYFPNDGEAYHLPSCATLQRNYIELNKSDAIERGYRSCSKCGG